MVSRAAVYVHAILMLSERSDTVARLLSHGPEDPVLLTEQTDLARAVRVFRDRLRRTENLDRVRARPG